MACARPTITIPLQGGLGNQLFQLAAGLAVSARTSKRIRFTDYWLRNPAPDETPRRLAIVSLLREDELVTIPVRRTGRITDRILGTRAIEPRIDYDTLGRVGRRTRFVVGYFQRYSYVLEAWPLLRRRFANSEDPTQRQLLNTASANYGALHYRLGDYRDNPATARVHGATSPDYFAQIIRRGKDRLGIIEWRLASDRPLEARRLLQREDLPEDIRLVTRESADEWSDLSLLASARLCAVSNSSFSWWAAFIGSAAHPMHVVAPRPWFGDCTMREPILFPSEWERRNRSIMRDAMG